MAEITLVVTRDQATYVQWCQENGRAPHGGPTRRLVYPHDLLGLRGPDTNIVIDGIPTWMSEQQVSELKRFIKQLEGYGAEVEWNGHDPEWADE